MPACLSHIPIIADFSGEIKVRLPCPAGCIEWFEYAADTARTDYPAKEDAIADGKT